MILRRFSFPASKGASTIFNLLSKFNGRVNATFNFKFGTSLQLKIGVRLSLSVSPGR